MRAQHPSIVFLANSQLRGTWYMKRSGEIPFTNFNIFVEILWLDSFQYSTKQSCDFFLANNEEQDLKLTR